MGVYIPDIKLPKDEPGAFQVIVMYVGADRKLRAECEGTHEVTIVPEHGDLIDKSGVEVLSWTDGEYGSTFEDGVLFVLDKLDELPVIIPAEGEDYEVPAEEGE